ncbi:Phytochrome-like protein cph2 [Paraliobacillus sp. PM-2]|uniref:EAL domain-containing protein n=1 Tax=Paraliobacillus sp. PM-2 TaxID=1462524 RepID=UPI00061BCB3D|nr:EAL domain-containing protein [Paraliobacillus sp. PM-2]CQR47928.1 Phytochrome-like protein cph2 [Paraliobacillus sp. PM-2]
MKSALKVSIIYLIFGLVWIFMSDGILHEVFTNFQSIARIQTIKGLLFVLVTMVLIYSMVRLLVKQHDDEVMYRIDKEEQLLEVIRENNQFRHLFEQSSSGMIITDPNQEDNPIVYVNEGFEKITGYNKKEILGKNCRFLQGKDTSEENKKKIRQALKNNEPIQIEIKNHRKDGRPFWNELKISPIFDDADQLLCFIGIQEDVTSKKIQTTFMENQLKIAKEIISSKNLFDTITDSCQMIEDHLDVSCMILRLDDEKQVIQCFGSSHIPEQVKKEIHNIDFNEYREHYLTTLLNMGHNQVGQMTDDPSFGPYWNIMLERGFQTFQITPIVSEDEQMLGIFITFAKHPEQVNAITCQTIEGYASILSFSLKSMQYLDQIKQSERRYRLIANNSTDFVCVIDEQLHVEYISPSHKMIFGENLDFTTIKKSLKNDSKHKLSGLIDQLKNGIEFERVEAELIDKNGKTHVIDIDGKRFLDHEEDKYKILLVSKDVTERKQFERSLNRVLYYDGLTQLPNRYYFTKLLEKSLAENEEQALFVLDFDQMKEINNMLGQSAEEYVLTHVVDIIKQALPQSIIARTGQDEFSILVEQFESYNDLENKVRNLLDSLDVSWRYQSVEFIATVSVGVSIFNGQSTEALIVEAELALKESRKKGKQQYYIYRQEPSQSEISSFSLQNELYHALDKKQFEVWYQPQIDLHTNNILGVEALIRWKHDTLGMISPAEFIPIAEETRWIVPIGTWVLKKVCQDVVAWRKDHHSFNASVNISYAQLQDESFIPTVKRILEETKCPASQLIFEITESMLMKDLSLSIRVLQELKALGIRIAVDDFGVGYSSLSYLKQFQLDYLKIDRAFVMNIHEDNNDFAIVQAIMEMARTLGLKVIVEGVERLQHVQLLQKIGCRYFQGYWYSKPIPKKELYKTIDMIYQDKFVYENR